MRDISGNEISGASNYPHIQMNCPVCLNSKSANCNGNLPGNQPLFPSRKCNGDCRCWASDPTSSPTTNPTESPSAAPTHEEPESSAMVRWENIEALLCFGVASEKAPGLRGGSPSSRRWCTSLSCSRSTRAANRKSTTFRTVKRSCTRSSTSAFASGSAAAAALGHLQGTQKGDRLECVLNL